MKPIEKFTSSIQWDELGNPVVHVDAVFEGGRVLKKVISFEDYKQLLFGSQKERVSYTSLARPEGFYKGFAGSTKGSFKVILKVPAGKHQFVSDKMQLATQLPYPALLFYLWYEDGRRMHADCFAVKSSDFDSLSDDTPLYKYPYGNVSETGGICMGNISVKMDSIVEANKFVDAFFEGIDEGHYYRAGAMAKPKLSQDALVRKVIEKGKFPDSWLMPSKVKKVADIRI